MMKYKEPIKITTRLGDIVGGGQTIASMEDGRKLFVWGGLPGELVEVVITKKKSKLAEGVVLKVLEASNYRVEPFDKNSFLATSPWQTMSFEFEQTSKARLIELAFKLHGLAPPTDLVINSDGVEYGYRNKMEFSWYWNKETNLIDLAFFQRGSHNKVPIEASNLARPIINQVAIKIRDLVRGLKGVKASDLKSLIVRCNQQDQAIAQLYVKDEAFSKISDEVFANLGLAGLEIIFSKPQSPASVITKKIQSLGQDFLTDNILGIDFDYKAESFFQVNLPVYEMALRDIKQNLLKDKKIIDLYSGVGTIGLSVADKDLVLVEINESAVLEMRKNIAKLNKSAEAILAPSQQVVDIIDSNSLVIVDPPRAGLDQAVIERLKEVLPSRIIYLSCNPVTQARDILRLKQNYKIATQKAYNFFPKTPHIESLIVLDEINQ